MLSARGFPARLLAAGPARLTGLARAGWARTLLLGLAAFLVAAPFLAATQEATVLVAARLLASVDEHAADVLAHVPIDPVYGGAALHIIGGIHGYGLALAGPVGAGLHFVAPTHFVAPELAPTGAVASAVLEPGATVFARTLADVAATVALLTVGIAVARWRGAPGWLVTAGALLQARVVVERVVEADLTLRDLEATGLPFAIAALAPVGPGGQRELFTRHLDRVPEALLGLAWGLLVAGVGYMLAYALVRGTDLAHGGVRRLRGAGRTSPCCRVAARPSARRLAVQGTAVAALAVGLVLTPVGVVANGDTTVRPDRVVADVSIDADGERVATDAMTDAARDDTATTQVASVDEASGVAGAEGAAIAAEASGTATVDPAIRADAETLPLAVQSSVAPATVAPPAPNATGGSVVRIEGGGYRFTYRVNGEPAVIRGMGYNPWYASLPAKERRRRYDRDFAAMRAIGVNTLEGWFQDQFDEVTLDAAHAHGLGVIMPFELNQDYDYADSAVRESFRAQVTAWVQRYQDHPAVRMWGPGNENLHRLIFPTVLKGQADPQMEARADAFARFYVELADLVRELDPEHPVVYRDAEDLYFARIRDALLRDGKARPWFVYGTNTYTPRLEEVIEQWPSQGLDVPLLVSEFSPGGVAPAGRPGMFGRFWSMIRARPEMVLGGVVYTWATEGPEDLDRIFGLTDADGRPVDGSLTALRRLFLEEGRETAALRARASRGQHGCPTGAEPTDRRDMRPVACLASP